MSSVPMPGTKGLAHHQLDSAEAHTTVSDPVSSPSHYTAGGIETIDAIEAWSLGFHLGNVVKYVSRAGKKDPSRTVEDLRKARWYLERAIERAEEDERSAPPRILVTPSRLTDEEAERIREQWRAVQPQTFAEFARRRTQVNADVVKALARFGRAIRAANERQEREARAALQRTARAGSAEDPSCFTMRGGIVADATGYHEGNRAEALHPQQGDA